MAAACTAAAGGKINNVVECIMYMLLPAPNSYDCSIQGGREEEKKCQRSLSMIPRNKVCIQGVYMRWHETNYSSLPLIDDEDGYSSVAPRARHQRKRALFSQETLYGEKLGGKKSRRRRCLHIIGFQLSQCTHMVDAPFNAL